MSLPVPNLDDRRFQDFVDDAKRLVRRRCPEWTDHNVSDPGVTLIEAFAAMADQLTYRLNRVPERTYVRFLDLLGVRLFPATPARVPVTFWLSAPQREPVRVPLSTSVATRRTPDVEPLSFSTVRDLTIVPTSLTTLRTVSAGGEQADHTEDLTVGRTVRCFSTRPAVDDVLLIGLSDAAPSCAIALRIDCDIEGLGVDPEAPPLRWEAFTGEGWEQCALERDETRALNKPGDVIVHLPSRHTASVIAGVRAGWLRARVIKPLAGRPTYTASPTLRKLSAFTIGGTVDAVNAELVTAEDLGTAEGVPGQQLTVPRAPVLPTDEPLVLEVADGEAVGDGSGWQEWRQVDDFSSSGPDDRHFVLDAARGVIELGPCVRLPEGTVQQYGAVPARGAVIRLRAYRTGGGQRGNISAHTLTVLRSSIPYVASVDNRVAARGGRDAEDVENAKVRGPLQLRSRHRAVTVEDYEQIASAAAPELARVRCVPGKDSVVRILLVPATGDGTKRRPFEELVPSEESLRRVAEALEKRRTLGARVVVEPPSYRGLTIVARLRALPGYNPEAVQAAALAALYRHYDPVHGGADGQGWPFGRAVQYGEVFAVLQRVRGVDIVEDVRLFPADPVTGVRGEPTQRIDVDPCALVFPYEHQVRVTTCED